MSRLYNPKEIEAKWQKIWAESPELNRAVDNDKTRQKYYVLVEFPYLSGEGLHTGHVRSYTAQDIIARRLRMLGKNVLYPIGWDAFGLPTENFAIKHKITPQAVTKRNAFHFEKQLRALGLSFDWSRKINTTDPQYYKWTQWIFLQFLKAGLAYQAEIPINWCPKEKIGLANEEVVDGLHERCGTPVEKKLLKQWMLKITAYADRLIEDLKLVDYPERVSAQQINWIGKSYGAEIDFVVGKDKITTFTTRADTLGGATFLVLAPEHPLVEKITSIKQLPAVKKYIKQVQSESELSRQEQERPKTGVFTGAYTTNPLTGEKIPVWVADYVLMSYGTGAVMAVPAHDERDYVFARKFKLPITRVITGGKLPFMEDGTLVNSKAFNSLDSQTAVQQITKKLGRRAVQYKLRDWVFSRQHYWGEPIPVIHCAKCGVVPVPEKDLPVELPEVKHYEPTETGESPLAAITDWVNIKCPKCAGKAKRETDTMPNWAGSSWYYLRYIDPDNDTAFANPAKLKYWLPVDLYNGGMEHTTLHLLYSRFWHKFLYDQGFVPTAEPYASRRSHGMILAADGKKMSKSLGNVINPDEMIKKYGADATRLYEMFMGPYDQAIEWNEDKLAGVNRFLNRVWVLVQQLLVQKDAAGAPQFNSKLETGIERMTHKTLKKIDDALNERKFNTTVAFLMEYVNYLNDPDILVALKSSKATTFTQSQVRLLILMLAPFVPHIAEELWHELGETTSVQLASWPKYEPKLIKEDIVTVVIQVDGKVRGEIDLPAEDAADKTEMEVNAELIARDYLKKHSREVVRTIVVPNKLVNLVTLAKK